MTRIRSIYRSTALALAALSQGDVKGFLGLRPIDVPGGYTYPDGSIFYPTRGTEGSVIVMRGRRSEPNPRKWSDKRGPAFYQRTRFGNRKIPAFIGAYILEQQHRTRVRTAAKRAALIIITTLAIIGALVLS